MACFGIDAPTLLHSVARRVEAPGHQLVAPSHLRSQALVLLFDDVRAGRLGEAEALERACRPARSSPSTRSPGPAARASSPSRRWTR